MEIIAKVFNYDDHRNSEKENSISVTTLIGPMYKAQKYLEKVPRDYPIDLMLKRSSSIGTGFHMYAEKALANDPIYVTEIFNEREVKVDGIVYTVAGSLDGLRFNGKEWEIFDWKTGYGKERKQDALDKDTLQMSIYRWINQDMYNIADRAWTLFISQSNNVADEIPLELMSLEETENYIKNKLWAIQENERVDCMEGIKYNGCLYCNFRCERRRK